MQLRRSAVRGEATMSRSSVSPALRLRCSKKPVCAGVLSFVVCPAHTHAGMGRQARAGEGQSAGESLHSANGAGFTQAAHAGARSCLSRIAACPTAGALLCAGPCAQEDAYAVHELGPSAVLPQGLCSSAKHAGVRIDNRL